MVFFVGSLQESLRQKPTPGILPVDGSEVIARYDDWILGILPAEVSWNAWISPDLSECLSQLALLARRRIFSAEG